VSAEASVVNKISENKLEHAMEMFIGEDASLRQVRDEVGISYGAALRIQRYCRCADIAMGEKARVNIGRRRDGTLTYYETTEIQPQWRKQQYGDEKDF
jgi:hypothetical protein